MPIESQTRRFAKLRAVERDAFGSVIDALRELSRKSVELRTMLKQDGKKEEAKAADRAKGEIDREILETIKAERAYLAMVDPPSDAEKRLTDAATTAKATVKGIKAVADLLSALASVVAVVDDIVGIVT